MWLKTSDDYPDDCARVRLSDPAYRTHHEGLSWAMRRENGGRSHWGGGWQGAPAGREVHLVYRQQGRVHPVPSGVLRGSEPLMPDDDVPMQVVGSLQHIRHLLAGLTGDLDTSGPLPSPTRWATEADDDFPGAVWELDWQICQRYGGLEVIAALEDVGDDRPAVYVRGLDWGSDVSAMTPADARAIGRALLAAADMAGSPEVARRCSVPVRARRK